MISKRIVTIVDQWIDGLSGKEYQEQPLAQDWARIAKLAEELGETIAELILATGQNPRKPRDPAARDRMLRELADTVMTGVYGIQHFTKDADRTEMYLCEAQAKHYSRVPSEMTRESVNP
jgi:hypothetical protein